MYFILVVTFLAFIHRVVRQRRATLAITNKWKSYKVAHKKTVQILGGVEKAITCWNIFILMLFNSGRRLLARHQTESLRFFLLLLLLWPDPQHQPTHCIVYQFMGTLKSRSHFKFELEHETPITSLSPYVLMISSDPLWDGWLRLSLSISLYSLAKRRNQSNVHTYTAMALILWSSCTQVCGV